LSDIYDNFILGDQTARDGLQGFSPGNPDRICLYTICHQAGIHFTKKLRAYAGTPRFHCSFSLHQDQDAIAIFQFNRTLKKQKRCKNFSKIYRPGPWVKISSGPGKHLKKPVAKKNHKKFQVNPLKKNHEQPGTPQISAVEHPPVTPLFRTHTIPNPGPVRAPLYHFSGTGLN
jgi:hypothetical protein